MTQKKRKKVKKFHVFKCWMFSLSAECFSCSLDVLYGGLGISKLQFMITKKNFSCKFFQFLVIKIPDPDWYST